MIGRSGLSLTTLVALAGIARAAGCDAVDQSFLLVQNLPAWEQKVTMTPPGKPASTIDMITMGDVVYMKMGGGPWRKQPMPAAQRKAMTTQMMKTMAPSDCTLVGRESVGGTPATVYAFRQPDVTKKGTILDVKMWIDADGLPLKSESAANQTLFYYAGVAAPIP